MKTNDVRKLPANDNGRSREPLADIFPDLAARRGAQALDAAQRAAIMRQLELQMGIAV